MARPKAPETATERVEIRLTPSQYAEWARLAKRKGITIKALAVEAVEVYAARDDEGALADLGRDVIALVNGHVVTTG